MSEGKSTVTQSTSRLTAWLGPAVPAVFIAITFAVGWSLGQPLSGETDASAVGSWFLFVVILASPFIVGLIMLVFSRTCGPVWWTALAYSAAAGILGVVLDIAVLRSESSTASLGLLSAIVVQLVVLAPVTVVVALIIWALRLRSARLRSAPESGSETQRAPTGKKFDRG